MSLMDDNLRFYRKLHAVIRARAIELAIKAGRNFDPDVAWISDVKDTYIVLTYWDDKAKDWDSYFAYNEEILGGQD